MAKLTSAERAKRLLAILHLLRPHEELSLDDIARTLGMSRAEVAEELLTLSCCGIAPYTPDVLVPISVQNGTAIVFGELPALERAVRLSESQAHAVLAALQAAGLPADDPLCQKLQAAAADGALDADQFEKVLTSAKSPGAEEALKNAARAIAEHRVLSLVYQGLAENAPRERAVEPVSLLNERGNWYLEAYARDAGALRTFRLDRVRESRVLAQSAPERVLTPSGSAIVTEGLPTATLVLDPSEEPTSRDWPGMRILSRDEAGTTIEVPYAGTAWIARQVLARLGAARVVGPEEVRQAVVALAEEYLASP